MKAKSLFKKEIAFLLVVVMLFSCWVFSATQGTSATAGNYTISIDAISQNDGDCKGMDVIVYYKPNNGTGTQTSKSIYSRSDNFEFDGTGNDDRNNVSIAGFPTKVEYKLCKRGGAYSMGTLKGYANITINGTSMGSTSTIDTSSEGWHTATWTATNAQYPYAKTADSFSVSPTNVTIPDGSTNKTATVSIGTVKDQYGVNWYQDGNGVSLSATGVSASGKTITVTKNAMVSGSPYYKDITLTAKCGSTNLTNTCTLRITNPTYTVTWYWHKNGDASSTWSGSTTSTGIYYNQTPSVPSGATGVTKYYDSAQHHSGGTITAGKVTNTNNKFYMSYSTNENHDYNYTALASSDANYHLKHTATCKVATCGYSKTENHDYDTTTFSFSQDGKTATATRVCKTNGCRHSQTETANVTSKVKTAATCTVKGTTTYTATSPFDGDTATDSVDKQDIAALGHSWKTPTFAWSADCSSCTATRECNRNSSHKETQTVIQIDSEVVADSTCTGKGTHKYTAHSPFAGDSTTNEKTLEDIAALGHDWNPTVITFAADGKTASATRTCKRDASHVETLAAPVSHVEKTAATCTAKGITTYTATSPFAGDTATKSVDKEDIAPLGHDWNPVTFAFAADGKTATATRVCRRDGEHVESAAAIMSHEVKTPATCEGDGTTTYTATSPWGDGAFDTVDRVDIAAIGHSWGDWEDLGENGHRRVCANDASHIESSATHTYTSYSKDWPEDATILAKLEEAGFNGETQCYRYCTACNNVEIKTHSYTSSITTQPTCTVGGVKTYTCEYCHTSYTQEIKALGHDPELVRGNQPSDTQAGGIYFRCKRDGCDTYFPATDDGTEFVANLAVPCANSTEAQNAESAAKVPFPTFNTYTDGDIGDYNYSLRGASLKLSNEADRDLNTIQKMRFSGSVMVPVGMETTIDPANYTKYQAKQYDSIPDDSVIDFGFVYTQHRCLLYDGDDGSGAYTVDPTKFEMGKDNIYSMSVVHKNENSETFDFGENNWSGVTAHNENNGTTLTFNLLINVTQKNWKRNYAARTYIIYKYHGEIYLVYDNMVGGTTISDRAVWYVAKAVLAMYDEGEETSPAALNMVNYIKEKIVRDDQKVEKAIFAYAEEQESTPKDYFSDWWKAYNGRGLPVDETYDPAF